MTIAGNPNVPGAPQAPVTFTVISPNPGPNQVVAVLKQASPMSRSGGTSASASSGGGGWQVTDRTRKLASTEWLDVYPLVQTLQMFVDGGLGLNPADVEDQCTLIESFELPVPGSTPQQPPILTIAGPVKHPELFWVCTRLGWDGGEGGEIRNAANLRTQAHFTIELTQYVPTSAISALQTPAQQAALLNNGNAGTQGVLVPSGQTYTVRQGDSLQSIAANVLHNFNDWVELALLNELSNSPILIPGTVLQLPAPS